MDFQVPIQIQKLPKPVNYRDGLLLIGSCFTEHIGNKLEELKFSVLQNPNGILFDPASIASRLARRIPCSPVAKATGSEQAVQSYTTASQDVASGPGQSG